MTLLIVNDEELTADTMRDTIDWKQYGIDDVFVAYQAEEARKILLAVQTIYTNNAGQKSL